MSTEQSTDDRDLPVWVVLSEITDQQVYTGHHTYAEAQALAGGFDDVYVVRDDTVNAPAPDAAHAPIDWSATDPDGHRMQVLAGKRAHTTAISVQQDSERCIALLDLDQLRSLRDALSTEITRRLS